MLEVDHADPGAHLLADRPGKQAPRFSRLAVGASLVLLAAVAIVLAIGTPILYFQSLDELETRFFNAAKARGREVPLFWSIPFLKPAAGQGGRWVPRKVAHSGSLRRGKLALEQGGIRRGD